MKEGKQWRRGNFLKRKEEETLFIPCWERNWGVFFFFLKRSACHPFPNELKIFLLFNQCEIKTGVNRIKEADFLGSQWLREQIDGLSCRLGLPSFCISIRVF